MQGDGNLLAAVAEPTKTAKVTKCDSRMNSKRIKKSENNLSIFTKKSEKTLLSCSRFSNSSNQRSLKAKIKSAHIKMITKSKKYLKNSILLLIIGVSLLLGCPASGGDQTTVFPITSSIPASGATNFSADGNIILTYNQAVIKGEGVITLLTYLPSVGKRVTIAIDDAQVSIAGNVVTIDPPIDLDMGISYILTIPAGVFLSAAGGNAIPADTLFFSTAPAIDITAPAISAAMSVGGATDLSANADIIVTFDEPVVKGSGEIILTPTVGAPITIAVTDPRVTIVGGVVTIDPMADLAVGTSYTLTIPAGAFIDASGNSSPPDTQSFMTAPALDTTPPMLSSSVPANNATDVNASANIVLTYDEAVQKGSGSITLQPSGGTVVTIPVSTAQVSVAGAVVTINPTTDLLAGTSYTLMVPAGVIDDLAGNSAGSFILNFATAAAADITPPTINSSAPTSGATINAFDNIVLMYSEALQKGSGSITLQPSVGTLVTIPISAAQVSVVASVVAIDPTADLVAGTSYTLSFPAGAFQDLAGNNAGSFTLNFNTAVPLDTTAPTISSRVPANNAMNVNIGANVVLTYSEAVQKGSGNITLSSAFGNISVPVSNSLVSISGNVVTVDPMVDLLAGTTYTLSFPAGVFQDLAGNNAGSFTLNFNTAAALDTTPPTIASSVPANGATGVAVGANIVLTYSEAVQKGSGSMTLSSAGGMVTISVSSALVSIAGAVVTINPTADLLDGTAYTLSFPAGVFQDLAGNNAGSLTRSFTTAVALDSTPPTIMSTLPAMNGTINSPDNIILTYSEAVQVGSGNITIGAITIPVSSAQVSIAGAVVTINPTADLLTGTSYTLSFSAGAFQDLAGNNAGSLTLNFNTAAALDTTPPVAVSSVPANGATGVDVGANIVLTYSEAVQKGSGSMTISSAGGMVTISVSSALVSVAGAVVTIDPAVDLLDGTAYILSFPTGVFQDLAGNNAGSLTRSFTTAVALDTTAPTVSSSVPPAAGTLESTADIVLTYNEAVQVGTGNITITASGGTTVTIAVTDATQVNVAGAVVTINPTADLTLTTYVLTVPAGAIEDLAGNASGESTLNFVAQATMIETIADLENVRNDLDGDYALAANIDLSSIDNWQPIGDGIANSFTGTFDGQDYQISGLNSSGYQYAGLFGSVSGGSISNLGVLVGTISSSSSGESSAGGLVGRADATSSISNSYAVVEGDISSSSSASTNALSLAGGLVGYVLSSSISNCYAVVAGDISSSSSSATANVSSLAGGLVGYAISSPISISNSYAVVVGDISSSSSSSSSSPTNVLARAGGLVGSANNIPVSNSYAVVGGSISATSPSSSNAGGLVGGAVGSRISNSYAVVGGNIFSSSSAGGLVGRAQSSLISNSYAVVGGNISSSSSAGGLVGFVSGTPSISNSYYSASRQSSEGNFTNTEGTTQTVAQLRALTATGTGWMAFYDASSAPAHALITDTSATFATGDRRLWHFGDNAQLPILNPSPTQVSAGDLSLYRARQHFVATASSATQINLSWSSAGATYTFYEVHRHTANDSSGATRVGSPQVSAVGRTYMDTGLTTGTTYYYWLKACAGSVCSDFFANTQTTTP